MNPVQRGEAIARYVHSSRPNIKLRKIHYGSIEPDRTYATGGKNNLKFRRY